MQLSISSAEVRSPTTDFTPSGRRVLPGQNRFTEWNHFWNRKWPRINNQVVPKPPTSETNCGVRLDRVGVFGLFGFPNMSIVLFYEEFYLRLISISLVASRRVV